MPKSQPGFYRTIQGNIRWDTIKWLLALFGITGAALMALAHQIGEWLRAPVQYWAVLALSVVSTALMALVWVSRARLTLLAPRRESIQQRPNGTGYINSGGGELALSLPMRNLRSWSHAALPEDALVTAHIAYFTELGDPVDDAYNALWINEQSSVVSFKSGTTKELILVIHRGRDRDSRFYVPDSGAIYEDEPENLIRAFAGGHMLRLRHISTQDCVLIAKVSLSSGGVASTIALRVFLERESLWAERMDASLLRRLLSFLSSPSADLRIT